VLLIPKRHRRTDRQTDGRLTVALLRSALASRGNKTEYRIALFENNDDEESLSDEGTFGDDGGRSFIRPVVIQSTEIGTKSESVP